MKDFKIAPIVKGVGVTRQGHAAKVAGKPLFVLSVKSPAEVKVQVLKQAAQRCDLSGLGVFIGREMTPAKTMLAQLEAEVSRAKPFIPPTATAVVRANA